MELFISNRLHLLCSRQMLHLTATVQLSRKINMKNMVVSRKEMAYQRVGTASNKASHSDISQESKLHFNSYSGFEVLEKICGTKNWKMTKI